jgi:hypothetical protein
MKREQKKTRRTFLRDRDDCSSSSNISLISIRLGVILIRRNRWVELNQELEKRILNLELSLM